ncbi:hypothetical protein FXB68_07510 [Aggregatibacter actinomycetemcomitans]|uniref:Toxin VasX N-terminal region domain-containing protein n=1 Tax=Aggregatibacter actinomycetemcomitans TaxID=714 RepID=A0AB74N6C9_AGGAC|nr:hypothetical protein [Aggregatibacter actinomycetemcomitans]TYA21762.1 hypothetical protein FXE08_03420 [Aggregatibacter actinomycetemcomitans]TYA34649.1 hypothetical protein FXB68_07510 [Aggregatibacter actinomycetemcomitans]TYA39541.1 hypothetical protein FXB79_02890 [Aggregatibacter actinomycetemcomitans]TYA41483.1 hypothetical protein FXB67_03925 [Aggregatibacter actinomycetemcomitans]
MKLCQEKNIIYPARLALTSARLEKISATPEPLSLLPYGLPAENSDYELRRLRDGYVYIITLAV